MSEQRQSEPSEEVDERQLELARDRGDSYRQSAEYMITEVAETGAKTHTDEYLVGIAQEKAEGMYRLTDGQFEWQEPTSDENCHLEVIVADADDGRFLPHLDVRVTVADGDGTEVESSAFPFVWHPGLYHYGRNLEIPGDGTYSVAVAIEPAAFPRHDEQNGDRYTEPVEVRFEDLQFTTGQS